MNLPVSPLDTTQADLIFRKIKDKGVIKEILYKCVEYGEVPLMRLIFHKELNCLTPEEVDKLVEYALIGGDLPTISALVKVTNYRLTSNLIEEICKLHTLPQDMRLVEYLHTVWEIFMPEDYIKTTITDGGIDMLNYLLELGTPFSEGNIRYIDRLIAMYTDENNQLANQLAAIKNRIV